MSPTDLPLRDVHLPASPSWWPPAPGWWWVGAALLLLLAGLAWMAYRRHARQRRWRAQFDREVAAAGSVAGQVAAMSGLLRRAARRIDPHADTLRDEAWLRLLDGRKGQVFSAGPGRLLLEGGFRRDPAAGELAALVPLARARFMQLMAGRR
ncbi:MAG TPA: DUF4381 family protein [Stenotrophomonas sp.]|jgi:hypothetical protein